MTKIPKVWILALISVAFPARSLVADTIYVDTNATGPTHDGSSWCDAYLHVQDALAAAVAPGGSVDQIRVADGVYKPDQGGGQTPADREATIQLVSGVSLEGGYAGCGEADPDARDVALFETILSGDLDGDDALVSCSDDAPDCDSFGRVCAEGACIIDANSAENSHHVVKGSGTDATAVLDGFTIRAGHADGGSSKSNGGGMYNVSGSPTVTNCMFSGNSAKKGGGMYNASNSNPVINNCRFNGNSASTGGNPLANPGGGMYNDDSDPTVINCMFSGNSARSGGGMHNSSDSDPTVADCDFNGNIATGEGGGMLNILNSNPSLTNSRFYQNSAGESGGGMWNGDSNPSIAECTFGENSASLFGGGMYNSESSPTISNSTFDMNSGTNAFIAHGGGMMNDNMSGPTVTNCTFTQNWSGSGGGMSNLRSSSPTVTDCTFLDNSAVNIYDDNGGGGMYNGEQSGPTVSNCVFDGNSASNYGGGVNNVNSDPILTECTFVGNWADAAGGLMNIESSPMVSRCEFTLNSAIGPYSSIHTGGGIQNRRSSPTIIACTFTGNSAIAGGGGLANWNSRPTVTDCSFDSNTSLGAGGTTSVGAGGGMYNRDHSPTRPPEFDDVPIVVSDCNFSNNIALNGGGMYTYNIFDNMVVTNCMFHGNSALNEFSGGGGLAIFSTTPVVTNCTFTANSTAGYGGGLLISVGGTPAVTNCIFAGNSAANGGGVFNDLSNPMLTNCTFSGNSAGENGAGMGNGWNSSPNVANCTFSENSAQGDGGGIHNSESGVNSPIVVNSVFWGNVDDANGAGGGPFTDESAQIHTVSGVPTVNYSIVQGRWTGAGGAQVLGADPMFFDPVGTDGIPGSEDDNLRLRFSSPAIDAGDNDAVPPNVADLDGDGNTAKPTPLDLDGNPRFGDEPFTPDTGNPGGLGAPIVDMGAFEAEPCSGGVILLHGDVNDSGSVNFADISLVVLVFKGVPAPITFEDADISPCGGDGNVNFQDISATVRAFQGLPACPDLCL